MKMDAFGLIYTGEENSRMRDLTFSRAVAALPFGARYRCIDFILSDMVNSGITSVGLITQKNYHSLMDHIGSGKEWDLNRRREGLFILPPFMTRESSGIYRGSVDAYRSCMGYVRRCSEKYIVLSGSSTIFNTTFEAMYRQHVETGADITIMYSKVPETDPGETNIDLRLIMDETGKVNSMELDPYHPSSDCRSCDVLIMDKTLFEYLVEEAYSRGEYSFDRDILLRKCSALRIFGYRYDGYVAHMETALSYFRNNMDLLDYDVTRQLFDSVNKPTVYTKIKDETSSLLGPDAKVKNTMMADGCEIEGTLENCIVFRGVKVGKGSVVRNSIIMQDTVIGENCVVDNVIFDKSVTMRNGRTIAGYDGFPVILRKNATI